ncbi:MFS sugar transporter like protein [Zymoseptoria brevis]|uniref:MFS sugar transporter like protein n=1 Tax=Zymoseptoria brevis TaxID=1047168 RepID=A0A0F4GPL3_9PEZI|nr:MFS sugar transporter like protein [Zymoseptoria brevis]
MADIQPSEGPRRRTGPVRDDVDELYLDDESVFEGQRNLFDDNNQGLIDNPLLRFSPQEIEKRTKEFVRTYDLLKQERVFVKAGKILRDPEAWESVPDLTAEEKDVLLHETQHGFWSQPKEFRVTIITLCVAAVVQGWNQTASNGANLSWPEQLNIGPLDGCNPKGGAAWIFAIVNAAPYFSASFIGCWLSDPISEYFFGRRPPIAISGALILASMIGGACVHTWQQLLACRVILGIGMGTKASMVPVFAAEISPAHIRGSLVMNWQLFDALGIFLGSTANLSVSSVGRTAWRWQTASSVFPTIVLLTLIFVCSDSPRFLMKRGPAKYKEAYTTLLALRGHPILAAKELLYVHYQMDVEKRFISGKLTDAEMGNSCVEDDEQEIKAIPRARVVPRFGPTRSININYWQKLGQLFTNKRIRRAMGAAVVCMISQQLCGVNVLALYSSNVFCKSAKDDTSQSSLESENDPSSNLRPLFLSWGIGLMNVLFAFPAYYLIDRKGRRWLLLTALPFMALCMFGASMSYFIPADSAGRIPAVGVWTYVFMAFYSWSMGPVPFTMSAEVFPLENRVVGMSFAVFTNMFGLGLLTLFVPVITDKLGHAGLLGIFAGLNVVAFVLIFFFVRETAGAMLGHTPGSMTFVSLEELNYLFGVSTSKHAIYQVKTVIPWIWSRYVKRSKDCDEVPEQLYTWNLARKSQRAKPEAREDDAEL